MEAKETELPFKVFWHRERVSEEFSLRLSKPSNLNGDGTRLPVKNCQNVSRSMVSAENRHALHIMHNLNHRNVVSMKALARSKLQTGDELSAITELCAGSLYRYILVLDHVIDTFNHIPSTIFQTITREVFDGMGFLWRNNTYHGNLNWRTTLYADPSYTVKLSGFKAKGLSLEKAQWEDWTDIIVMLESVSDAAAMVNADPQEGYIFCDEINTLIARMKASLSHNCSLLAMRELVFEEVFFWTPGRRAKFAMVDISKLLGNTQFIRAVRGSDVCCLPWDRGDTNSYDFDLYFVALLKTCNGYRDRLNYDGRTSQVADFDPKDKMDCVKFVYAAYTHRNEIEVVVGCKVDYIIRAKFPKFFVVLNSIVKAFQ